jgi:hypothetical protein
MAPSVIKLPGREQDQPLREGDELPGGARVGVELYFEAGDLAH